MQHSTAQHSKHTHSAGMANSDPSPMGSDDEFATLPATAASQPPPAAADAPAGATAASGSGLSWNKQQEFALHDYVTSILELQGGRDDNPKLYEDIAARSALWGPNSVTSAELQEIYFRVSRVSSAVSRLCLLPQRLCRSRGTAGYLTCRYSQHRSMYVSTLYIHVVQSITYKIKLSVRCVHVKW